MTLLEASLLASNFSFVLTLPFSMRASREIHAALLHMPRRCYSSTTRRSPIATGAVSRLTLRKVDTAVRWRQTQQFHAPTLRAPKLQRLRSRTAALTESAELPLGTTAPHFELVEPLTGKAVTSAEFDGASALLVIFMCNHCPFVKLLKEALVKLANDYESRGVQLVAISANSIQTHPQDGPEQMAEDVQRFGYPFPYLYDETQEVAKQYQAACTPEFFLFDGYQKLQYHGQFDSSRPSNDAPTTGEDVRNALDMLLAGQEPTVKVKPSIGCNIKWHPGNAPAYAQ